MSILFLNQSNAVHVEVPQNTATKDEPLTKTSMKFATDVQPANFLDDVCAKMGINRADANLAYRFASEAASVLPCIIKDLDDMRAGIDEYLSRLHCACTRIPILVMVNMVSLFLRAISLAWHCIRCGTESCRSDCESEQTEGSRGSG
jgi:hypothetical protein